MKKILIYFLTAVAFIAVGCSESYDDSALVGRVDSLENRVAKLEELCRQMNTNISSLQTLVSALENNDYVTGVTPITKDGEVVGYTITFTKSQPITIYHGEDGKDGQDGADGKDGQNGADGKDGHTPIIGVKQDTDGIYYWTLDGDWLLDDKGNKIKAQGTDGKDGADGKDGQDGTDGKDGEDGVNGTDGKDGDNGADGKDGITPKLKIENEYWYISYDNGTTWTQLGKATGNNGVDGTNGDSMFNDVTFDEYYIYFELTDGTTIKLSRGNNLTNRINSISYIPTHNDNKISVNYYGKGFESMSKATVDFLIMPKSIVSELTSNNIKIISTETQTRIEDVYELEITSFSTDSETGKISISIDCSTLPDDFFNKTTSKSIALCITDTAGEICSDFISMIPELQFPASNQILYTSSDDELISSYILGNSFDANIVSNTYSNGYGIVVFDNDISSIGNYAFDRCNALTSISIPQNVTSIGDYAFRGCNSLTNIYIPQSVTTIGGYTFAECSGLTSISIPQNVTTIGSYAFDYCGSLTNITIPQGVTSIENGTFNRCSSLTNVNIPYGVTSIGLFAFSGCSSLTSINIPNSVTTIGECALLGCSSLKSIYGKFASDDNRCIIVNGALKAFAPFELVSYQIPNEVTSIDRQVFESCQNLEAIIIPESVNSIEMRAFAFCSKLKSIIIPNGIAVLKAAMFYGCSELTSVTIPNSVTEIEDNVFNGCSNLKNITLPDNTTSIGLYVFENCSNLETIYSKFSSTDNRCLIINNKLLAFAPSGLTSYNIPEGVKSINFGIFRGCTALENITIPSSVTYISDYVFNGCQNLKSIYCKPTTPPTLTYEGLFRDSNALKNIYVPTPSVDTYKAANGWKDYADKIVGYNFE